MKTVTIHYKPIGEHTVPARGSEGAAGWDLYAAKDAVLFPYLPTLVATNLEIAFIPKGFTILILPRSGNSLKKRIIIPNSPGLIDEDYRGHLQVILTWIPRPVLLQAENDGVMTEEPTRADPTWVKKGERIAQAVVVEYKPQEWYESKEKTLPPTNRGTGGFGSTGS